VDARTVVRPLECWGFNIERQVESETISRLLIADRQMRVGCAKVRMGGIGGVWTDADHRKRGHMRAVMDHGIEFMREEGFEVSLLFGITDFYPRWGYATMIPDERLVIPTENALRAASDLRVRAYRRGEMPRLERIYDSLNALRTCSIVRPYFRPLKPMRRSSHRPGRASLPNSLAPTIPKDTFRMGTRFFTTVTIFVVEDQRGRIVGYGVYDREHLDPHTGERTPIEDEVAVAEVGATQEQAYDAILAHLGKLASRRKVEQIVAFVPVDDPFALHCRSYGAEQHISTRADGSAMMRIINLEQLMGKLAPELTRRVAGRGLSAKLSVVTDIGSVAVRVSNRSARVVTSLKGADYTLELAQWKLLQLLIGYRTLEDVLADPRKVAFVPSSGGRVRRRHGAALAGSVTCPARARKARVPTKLRELAAALFPTQWPFCWRPDWF